MNTFAEAFDDSKLYESIFGENQRWKPGQSAGNAYRPSWYDGWSAMASANKEAADHLVDWLFDEPRHGPMSGSLLTYPIMSLYRHYLELSLKGLLIDLQKWDCLATILSGENYEQSKGKFDHQLLAPWKMIRTLLYKIDADELAIEGVREETDEKFDAIENRIKEFNDIDERATSFRYPVEKDGEPTSGVPLSKDELLQVKGATDALELYLSGISCGVHETISGMYESLAIRREIEAEYAWEVYYE